MKKRIPKELWKYYNQNSERIKENIKSKSYEWTKVDTKNTKKKKAKKEQQKSMAFNEDNGIDRKEIANNSHDKSFHKMRREFYGDERN